MKNIFLIFYLIFSFNIFSQVDYINAKGFVTSKDFRLGNATIYFYDSLNEVRTTKSKIDGSFSVNLPKNKYRVFVKKDGYTFLGDNNFFVDYIFSPPSELILNMRSNNIEIGGRIVDSEQNPIRNALIKMKVAGLLQESKSNSNGFFTFIGDKGLTSIFAEKNGYYGNGTVLYIQNENYINNVQIELQQQFFIFNGLLIKGTDFLKDTEVFLINSRNNNIISKTISGENGFYEFRDIPYARSAYISIPKYNYKSSTFKLDDDVKQFNIFIK